jgi:periplasmic protein TonB
MSEREQRSEINDPPGAGQGEVRIVDLVFAGEPGGRVRRLAVGGACVVALYATAILVVGHFGRSGASICAEMAARVHDAIAAERAVDVTPPPPPPPAETPPTPHVAEPAVREHAHTAAVHHAPAPPAQAGQIAAASPSPLDFTGSAFVVGSGSSYAGGTTTSTGTNRKPATGAVAPNGTGDGAARSRARPVSLDQAAWNCPWPAEADARQVDQETVVIRVVVGTDGRAERVDVLQDPGFGFGPAARQCALATRFGAARNPAGDPIAALSPPIRVHFFR